MGSELFCNLLGIVAYAFTLFFDNLCRNSGIIQFHFGKLKVKVATALSWSCFVVIVCLFVFVLFLNAFQPFYNKQLFLNRALETKCAPRCYNNLAFDKRECNNSFVKSLNLAELVVFSFPLVITRPLTTFVGHGIMAHIPWPQTNQNSRSGLHFLMSQFSNNLSKKWKMQ